jgi:hypothetical protein
MQNQGSKGTGGTLPSPYPHRPLPRLSSLLPRPVPWSHQGNQTELSLLKSPICSRPSSNPISLKGQARGPQ